jgi:NAD+ kinase
VLRAAHLVGTAGVPIVGVNVGRFGFLTEVDPAHVEAAVTRVLEGDHVVEQVMTLELTLPDGKCVWALNDVVLEKVESQRLVRLQLEVNGEIFTVYTCDGLIIATPTGSTAYNFSVGGPVVSPGLPCLIVVAVSPHMLFSRALVLAPTDHLTVHVMEDRPVGVTADGLDAGIVPVGDSVALGIGATRIPFIRFEPESFPRRLARKFGL